MQNINLNISGYKCFKNRKFELKDITLLTGSNGTGKSSFIQVLLLIRAAIEKNCSDSKENDFINNQWKSSPIPLNGLFELNLGTIYDIFNYNDESENQIDIELGTEVFKFNFPESDDNDDVVKIDVKSHYEHSIPSFWRKKEFYYLNTERLGPRLGVDATHTDFIHCGYRGENTGKVLFKYGLSIKINDARFNTDIKSPNLQNQVDAWLNTICPGTIGVISNPQGPNRFQIVLKSSAAKKNILAPNIGFGISYALPIIVNGLIAQKGSVFIVENPEAHLHPKGQSNIGFFLGMVAASGVRVIIETHSEHVVNGIRKASLSTEFLSPKAVGIYFFEEISKNEDEKTVEINDSGDLTSFPTDFFDQVNQDLSELFRLKNILKNGKSVK